ncbi:SurA N-terminal domain-containing protein [Jiella sonneratiae]|uniref:Peptidylprolyl isomerase n=1 Tax=Jiella sonneratiae TaxID=2816856 RepID=A0ABS3JAP0_9HYPH|nr:SurA N-terminal domain-containing protein [Jiella sonneratiae]MBO0906217.1 peptidylprolyl isomerase [Jiella sonneratiae]
MTFVRLLAGLAAAGAILIIAPADVSLAPRPAMAATEVAVVVNGQPITTYQIRQRAAFLKLRREGGNLTQKATDELIDEALKQQETRRRGIKIPDQAVDQAFGNFASQNKLTTAQLTEVLSRAGFSASGFKDYIRTQMGWGQAVQASVRKNDRVSEQEAVQRMLAQGGKKPKTTEYTLQQVIFVIPEAERKAKMSLRKREAEGMRSRMRGCAGTYDIAKNLVDVTVRDLGRVATPELPPRWKDSVEATSPGKTTPVQETERGAEFIAVCNTREVSDDATAAMVFQSKDLEKLGKGESGPDKELLDKLKKNAQIVRK